MVRTTKIGVYQGVIQMPFERQSFLVGLILPSFFFFLFVQLDAQAPDWHWAKSLGSTASDWNHSKFVLPVIGDG